MLIWTHQWKNGEIARPREEPVKVGVRNTHDTEDETVAYPAIDRGITEVTLGEDSLGYIILTHNSPKYFKWNSA